MKHISSGISGDVFGARVTKEFREALMKTYKNPKTFNKLMPHIPRVGTIVAIKIERKFKNSLDVPWNRMNKNDFYENMAQRSKDSARYLRRVKREMTIGSILYNYKGPRGHRGKQFFPKLYAMFTEPECGFAITVMEYIEGVPLQVYISGKRGEKRIFHSRYWTSFHGES